MGIVINGKGQAGPTTTINKAPVVKAGRWMCDKEYCLASDNKTVVLADDPRAAFLLYPKGEIIKVEDKAKYHLPLKDPKPTKPTKPTAPPKRRGIHVPGQSAPEEDKAVTPGESGVEVK